MGNLPNLKPNQSVFISKERLQAMHVSFAQRELLLKSIIYHMLEGVYNGSVEIPRNVIEKIASDKEDFDIQFSDTSLKLTIKKSE